METVLFKFNEDNSISYLTGKMIDWGKLFINREQRRLLMFSVSERLTENFYKCSYDQFAAVMK